MFPPEFDLSIVELFALTKGYRRHGSLKGDASSRSSDSSKRSRKIRGNIEAVEGHTVRMTIDVPVVKSDGMNEEEDHDQSMSPSLSTYFLGFNSLLSILCTGAKLGFCLDQGRSPGHSHCEHCRQT